MTKTKDTTPRKSGADEMKAAGGGHIVLSSGYELKTLKKV
jgi:hypothetical protein